MTTHPGPGPIDPPDDPTPPKEPTPEGDEDTEKGA